jgi:hypothetical protein
MTKTSTEPFRTAGDKRQIRLTLSHHATVSLYPKYIFKLTPIVTDRALRPGVSEGTGDSDRSDATQVVLADVGGPPTAQ